ncbi:MAG: hypothetical protein ABIG63_16010 [Chloroflexota bacterium]
MPNKSLLALVVTCTMGVLFSFVTSSSAQSQAEPIELGAQIGGATLAVAVNGTHAYIGIGPRLAALDVTDPANPVQLGASAPLSDTVQNIAINADLALVTTSSWNMLHIFSLSDPAQPVEIGTYTPSNGRGVRSITIAAPYAYLTNGDGVYIINISTPSLPQEISFTPITEGAADIAILPGTDTMALISSYANGLIVLDISDPVQPEEITHYSEIPTYGHIDIVGDYAYLISHFGLHIVDIHDLSQITEVGYFDTYVEYSSSLEIGWPYAYLISWERGLQIVDLSDHENPTQIGQCTLISHSRDIAISGNTVYIASYSRGLTTVDVGNPAAPQVQGDFQTLGDVDTLSLAGDYAYSTSDSIGMGIVDISTPLSPTLVSTVDTPGNAIDLVIRDQYAYIADSGGGLQIFDITNPSTPQRVGYDYSLRWSDSVEIEGDRLYIRNGETISMLDLTDPISPSLLGTYVSSRYSLQMIASDNKLYLRTWDGLEIVDVSNPITPTKLSEITVQIKEYVGEDIALADGYAYLVGFETGLTIVDVSDPSQPFIAHQHNLPFVASNIMVQGHYLFAASWSDGLKVYEIYPPGTFYEVGHQSIPREITAMTLRGDYLYAANGYGGLHILLWEAPTRFYTYLPSIQR